MRQKWVFIPDLTVFPSRIPDPNCLHLGSRIRTVSIPDPRYSLIRIKICCEFALVSISVAEPWHFGVDPDLILRNPDPDLRLTNPDPDLWLTDQDPQHWFQWATESREANQCGSGSTTMRIRNSGITAYYLNANWAFIFDICLLSSAALVVLECHRWYLYEIKNLFKRGDRGKIDSWK